MPYRYQRSGRVFVVFWEGLPTVADVLSLHHEIVDAHRSEKAKLAYIAVVPQWLVQLPGPEARAAFTNTFPSVAEVCAFTDMVVEGDGIQKTLLRALIRAIGTASNIPGKLGTSKTFEAALARARRIAPDDVSQLDAAPWRFSDRE